MEFFGPFFDPAPHRIQWSAVSSPQDWCWKSTETFWQTIDLNEVHALWRLRDGLEAAPRLDSLPAVCAVAMWLIKHGCDPLAELT